MSSVQPIMSVPELLKNRLMLRVREYADLTGTPAPTVYALLYAGRIPGATRIGNSWRIPVRTLLDQLGA